MAKISEGLLPGIGKKHEITTDSEERLVIVSHDEGQVEMYYFEMDDEEPIASITMTAKEARQVGSILQSSVYEPHPLEKAEFSLEGLSIEWVQIPKNSPVIGKTIGQLELRKKHNVNIIAILGSSVSKHAAACVNPGPDFVFQASQVVITSGRKCNVDNFEAFVQGKEAKICPV